LPKARRRQGFVAQFFFFLSPSSSASAGVAWAKVRAQRVHNARALNSSVAQVCYFPIRTWPPTGPRRQPLPPCPPRGNSESASREEGTKRRRNSLSLAGAAPSLCGVVRRGPPRPRDRRAAASPLQAASSPLRTRRHTQRKAAPWHDDRARSATPSEVRRTRRRCHPIKRRGERRDPLILCRRPFDRSARAPRATRRPIAEDPASRGTLSLTRAPSPIIGHPQTPSWARACAARPWPTRRDRL